MTDRPNVLFISIDDMRPQLGCYGHELMVTPRIDALAASGIRFDRAFCNLPVCGPSRAAVMTGLRPNRDRFTKRNCYAAIDAPDAVPINTHFRDHGYHTISNGKIFDQIDDHRDGWSEPPWRANDDSGRFFDCYALPESLEAERVHKAAPPITRGVHRGPAYEAAPVSDDAYSDGMTAARAVEDLRRVSNQDEPFFMGVGFPRPHLPFIAPQRYWDLYDFDDIQLPSNYRLPSGAPDAADRDWNELRMYAGMPKHGPVPDEEARRVIHGYYACVSYIDTLVGRLIDELDALELTEKTIVVLWADHGYNLGEHGMWCKHTTFETNMRVPLIVRAPGLPTELSTSALVVLNDVYPSLCELAGLPVPDHVEGQSFVDLMNGSTDGDSRDVAFGRMYQAETVRVETARYTEFYDPATGANRGRMLFDHDADPDETVNVAELPANRDLVGLLSAELHSVLDGDHPLHH
jgi:iduronate 2-sulfatase